MKDTAISLTSFKFKYATCFILYQYTQQLQFKSIEMLDEVQDQYLAQSNTSQQQQKQTFRVSARKIQEQSVQSTSAGKHVKEDKINYNLDRDSCQLSFKNERSVSKMTFNTLLRQSAIRNRNQNNRTPVSSTKHEVNGTYNTQERLSIRDHLSNSSMSNRNQVKRISFRTFVNVAGNQSNRLADKDLRQSTTIQRDDSEKNNIRPYEGKKAANFVNQSQNLPNGQIGSLIHAEKTQISPITSFEQKRGSNHSSKEKQNDLALNQPDIVSDKQTKQLPEVQAMPLESAKDPADEALRPAQITKKEEALQIKSVDLNIVDLEILPPQKEAKSPKETKSPQYLSPQQTQSQRGVNARSLSTNFKNDNHFKSKAIHKKAAPSLPHFISNKTMNNVYQMNHSIRQTPQNSNDKQNSIQTKKGQNAGTPIGVYHKTTKFKNDFPLENYDKRGYLNLKKTISKTPRAAKQAEVKKSTNAEQSQNQHFASIQPSSFQKKQSVPETRATQSKKTMRSSGHNFQHRPNVLTNSTSQKVGLLQVQNTARQYKTQPISVRNKYSSNSRIPSVQPKRQIDSSGKNLQLKYNQRSAQNSPPEKGPKVKTAFPISADKKVSKQSTPEKTSATNIATIQKATLDVNAYHKKQNTESMTQPTKDARLEADEKQSKEDCEQNVNQTEIMEIEQKIYLAKEEESIDRKEVIQKITDLSLEEATAKQDDNQAEVQQKNDEIDQVIFDSIDKKEKIDEKTTQKLVHYQSQDLLKDSANMQLDRKDTNSELICEQQNSMLIEINQDKIENETKKSTSKNGIQIQVPPQDMMSWQSPNMQSLNILQKDGDSHEETMKTPHLANFGLNSPRTGTSIKKCDINASLDNQDHLILMGKRSLNTMNANDSGMNIQENPFSRQSSVMQSFQKDQNNQNQETELRKCEDTVKDEDSIINNIQPQLLKQKNSKHSFLDVLTPNQLTVVPEMQPQKGFDDLQIQSKDSFVENAQNEVADSNVLSKDLKGAVPTNDETQVPNKIDDALIEVECSQQEKDQEFKKLNDMVSQAINVESQEGQDPQPAKAEAQNDPNQQVVEFKKSDKQKKVKNKKANKDSKGSDSDDNSQSLMAEMNASFSSKLIKQKFNVHQQLQLQINKSHSPTRAYIKPFQKQIQQDVKLPTTPKIQTSQNYITQFEDLAKSNQNLHSQDQSSNQHDAYQVGQSEAKNATVQYQKANDGELIDYQERGRLLKNERDVQEGLQLVDDPRLCEPSQPEIDQQMNTNQRYVPNPNKDIQESNDVDEPTPQNNFATDQPQFTENDGIHPNQPALYPTTDQYAEPHQSTPEHAPELQGLGKNHKWIGNRMENNLRQTKNQNVEMKRYQEIEEEVLPQTVAFRLDQLPMQSTYFVTFRMKYKVNYGEEIAIVGNLKQLGNWTNTCKARLKWTEGDIWVLQDMKFEVNNPVNKDITKKARGSFFFDDVQPTHRNQTQPYFQYKYVVIDSHSKQIIRIEQGPNRLADLNLKYFEAFEPQTFQNDEEMNDYIKSVMCTKPEHLIFNDMWETISVNFSMYYPLKEGEIFRVFGDTLQLGNWSCKIQGYQDKPGELEAKIMTPMSKQIQWLTGEMVSPYEYSVKYNLNSMPRRIKYKYSIHNEALNRTIWEREPTRELQIQDPNDYKGELGKERSNLWRNVFPVFIVNGHVEKADANFVGNMRFDQIGNTSIWLGPYPQTESDIDLLKESGLTGVFNVQTNGDLSFRGVNQQLMMKYYKEVGINAVHFPIQDFNEYELTRHLLEAAKILNDMINRQGLNVYVHCTAGMGRAPACVLSYLCLFKKVNGWQDPYNVDRLVKSYRKVSVPNMNAVCNVINQNHDFQCQQHESIVE